MSHRNLMTFSLLTILPLLISSSYSGSNFVRRSSSRQSSRTKVTSARTNSDVAFVCEKEGYFRSPKKCDVFYRCVSYGNTRTETGSVELFQNFEFQCGPGTVFDTKHLVCNWPYAVDCDDHEDVESMQHEGNVEVVPNHQIVENDASDDDVNELIVNEFSDSSTTAAIPETTTASQSSIEEGTSKLPLGLDETLKYTSTEEVSDNGTNGEIIELKDIQNDALVVETSSENSNDVNHQNRLDLITTTTETTTSSTSITSSTTTSKPIKKVIVRPRFPYECEDVGFYPHKMECRKFWLCSHSNKRKGDDETSFSSNMPIEITPRLYVCPEEYLYDQTSRRCEKAENVTCSTKKAEVRSSALTSPSRNDANYLLPLTSRIHFPDITDELDELVMVQKEGEDDENVIHLKFSDLDVFYKINQDLLLNE